MTRIVNVNVSSFSFFKSDDSDEEKEKGSSGEAFPLGRNRYRPCEF
jgi:hypothetical protein